jgi:AcrR family transcriptional regulator
MMDRPSRLNNDGKASPRARRQFDVDRSIATRTRLFESAIECLTQVGFAATTTILIAEKAEVSRGAMLHQFASKAELIQAVYEYCSELTLQEHRRRLQALPSDEERFRSLLRVIWSVSSEPYVVALSEIEMGYRSDPALIATFAPIIGDRQADRIKTAWIGLATRIGITDLTGVEAMAMMHLVAVRGLIVTRLALPSENLLLNLTVNLLDDQTQQLIDQWLEAARKST